MAYAYNLTKQLYLAHKQNGIHCMILSFLIFTSMHAFMQFKNTQVCTQKKQKLLKLSNNLNCDIKDTKSLLISKF